MMRDLRRVILGVALALAAGCSSNDTAIVVEVWSDLDTPEDIDALVIALDSTPVTSTFALPSGAAEGRPRVIKQVALVPQGNSTSTRMIEAAGLKGDTRRVAQAARLAFVKGQRRVLTLYLGSDCLEKLTCPGVQTCRGGSCIDPDRLLDQVRRFGDAPPSPDFFKPTLSVRDGGPVDAPRPGLEDARSPLDDARPPVDDAHPLLDGDPREAAGGTPPDLGVPGADAEPMMPPPDAGRTCPPGQKICGAGCINADSCCTSADCTPVADGTVACTAEHACEITCAAGRHLCGTSCLSNTATASCGSSCMACPQPTGGMATCNGTSCGVTCLMGKVICGSTCIDPGAPCNGTCPANQHACGGFCVANDNVNNCGTSSCMPCPAPPANATSTCNGVSCGFTCRPGFKPCGANRCIADSACCTPADCAPIVNADRTCSNGICGISCHGGHMLCGGDECRPMVAESCYNNLDDDCDGDIDCADQDCANPVAVCMPTAGVTPGTQVAQNTSCPASFTAMTNLFSGLVRATANDCSGCNCTGAGRMTCSLQIRRYTSMTMCQAGGPTGIGAVDAKLLINGDPCWLTSNAGGWHFPALTPMRSCAAANGTPVIPAPTWGSSTRFCAAGPRGGGCGAGRACVPRPPSLPICVLAPGATPCPTGFTGMQSMWFTGFTGSQSCSCLCNGATGGSCAGVTLQMYGAQSVGCDFDPITESAFPNNNCGIPRNEFRLVGTPPVPTCALAKTINGALTETGQQTLCCM